MAYSRGVRDESDAYAKFIDDKLEVTCDDSHRMIQADLEKACKDWVKFQLGQTSYDKTFLWKVLIARGATRKGAVRIAGRTPQGFTGVRYKIDATI